MRIKGIKIDEAGAMLDELEEQIARAISFASNPDEMYEAFRFTIIPLLKQNGISANKAVALFDAKSRKKLGKVYSTNAYTDADILDELKEVYKYEAKNEGFISPAEERQIAQCFIRCGQDIDKTIETLRLAATHFEEADIRNVCAYYYVDLASEDWFTKHPDWEEDMPIEAYNKILKDAEEILGEKLRDDYYV